MTEEQLGSRAFPDEDPSLMFVWPDVLDRLRTQLQQRPRDWGHGQTLVFSMLTDGFSPWLVKRGITSEALRLVLDHTRFRIRVLTKNAVVGTAPWLDFFSRHPARFVVGLSTGTTDDEWAGRIEVGTSTPTARLSAMRALQDAGVPTYAMLCPVFPDVLASGQLDRLLDQVRPELVEHVWAEPYNDRVNWRVVRDSYPARSAGHEWFTTVFEHKNPGAWSRYATELYVRLRARAEQGGWLPKLRYLLYEEMISAEDALRYAGLRGVLLQSKPAVDGTSRNAAIAAWQR
jgi:DNA repair photolyase